MADYPRAQMPNEMDNGSIESRRMRARLFNRQVREVLSPSAILQVASSGGAPDDLLLLSLIDIPVKSLQDILKSARSPARARARLPS